MITGSELVRFLRENLPVGKYVEHCYMNKEADTLTMYFAERGAEHSKKLCGYVTLYLSPETDEVVGCRIENISELLGNQSG